MKMVWFENNEGVVAVNPARVTYVKPCSQISEIQSSQILFSGIPDDHVVVNCAVKDVVAKLTGEAKANPRNFYAMRPGEDLPPGG